MHVKHTNMETLISKQIQKWEAHKRASEKEKKRTEPVIAIARLPGSSAEKIAQTLADEISFDYYDNRIIETIAKDSQISAALLESLDEKAMSMVENWVLYMFSTRSLWREDFMSHLTRLFASIAKHGNAVILGRGASFSLDPRESFRVLVVAPLEARVAKVKSDLGITEKEARKRVEMIDSERKGYVRQYFHADIMDPVHYDVCINSEALGIQGSVNLIKSGWQDKKAGHRKDKTA